MDSANHPSSDGRISPAGAEPHPDLELVTSFLAGEASAIEPFTKTLECVARILSAKNARMGRPLGLDDLADLVQDVHVVVLQKVHAYAGHSPLEGWLYRVCQHEFRNGLRRKRKVPVQLGEEPLIDAKSLGADESEAVRDRVLGALARVGGVEAELISLKHHEGLTFDEIAERLDIPTSTAKTRYYRGLGRFEQVLNGEKEGDEAR